MKYRCAVLALILLTIPAAASAQIAIVTDGPSDLADARAEALAAEVKQLTRDDPKPIQMPMRPTHVGDYTLDGVRKQLKAALADRSVKAVVGLGLLVGVAVGELDKSPKKPIVLPYAAPRIQGLPIGKKGSGVRNLTYVTGLVDFDQDLKRFREVIRDRKVAFMIDDFTWKTFLDRKPPEVKRPDEGRDDVVVIPIPPTAEGALAALPKDAEAAYLFPHFRMSFAEREKFIAGLNQRRLPTYVATGPEWVEKGGFVTLTPADLETERFRRAALYLRDALSGESLASVSTAFARRTELVINMATARAIGVYPRFELMTEARLVGQDKSNSDPKLTLRDAITEAIERNPSLQALREQRSASKAELRQSRGNLLPQINGGAGFAWIDPDIANSLGNAEREISLSASASQVIYSPLAFNAYFAQEDLYRSVQEQVEAGRLDLVLELVQSYLRVLQAEAIERLNRQNLGRVRTNRALAELRVEIGTSGPQDIARWDIELADGRADTISASATRNQAEIDLNRVLAYPLERSFSTVDPEKDTDALLIDPRARRYVQDLFSFRIYRGFMAQEALRNAPELKQLDAQIEAQDNLIAGYVNQLYIPTLSTDFGINYVADRSGMGSEAFQGEIPIVRDDFTWQWGVNLSFTIYDDIRYGTIEQARRVRAQIVSTRQDTVNRIEQGVRSALHQAGASGAAVSLRRDAVKAALVNLEAVTDAYRQGTVNIITLIDAQNQALSAEINAANALYQYLSDFAQAERSSGRFLILEPTETRDDFFQRLDAYANQAKTEAQQETSR